MKSMTTLTLLEKKHRHKQQCCQSEIGCVELHLFVGEDGMKLRPAISIASSRTGHPIMESWMVLD